MEADLVNEIDGVAERLVPELSRGQLVEAEHLARYWWATTMVEGKTVLDAGCGTAYGTRILAEAGASTVVGVDVAEGVLAAARPGQPPSVSLEAADVQNLPYDHGTFDVVVCFEVIEHVADPELALDELARVIADNGLLCVSSPNRRTYIEGNPHHRHEYVPEELEGTLRKRFSNVMLLRQDDWLGSAILDDDDQGRAGGVPLANVALRKTAAGEIGEELYTVGVASNGDLPDGTGSVVLTHMLEVRQIAEAWRRLRLDRTALERERARISGQLDDAEARATIAGQAAVKSETARAHERERLEESENARAQQHERLKEQNEVIQDLHEVIREMQSTRVWRVGSTWWRLRDRLLPRS
jgi:SAM-dependent methyltransferase